ncbi:AAA family ATPase [Paraburkholderia sp. C35]|uniref:AAA family ATPase n=1 Tax=Paraburkholderia sp. C35 TaxID=2126993 RepID=UPI0013A571E5|nr:AAA family ATPase [Paraburkholderia sp. C35]
MKIKTFQLKDFKRFTDLTISDIPETAKLVLLIGPNGSGKSCIFDGFEWISRLAGGRGTTGDEKYFWKTEGKEPSLQLLLQDGSNLSRTGNVASNNPIAKKFYGRSSLRVLPRLAHAFNYSSQTVETDNDRPAFFIEHDSRFLNDVYHYAANMNKALRNPTFRGESANTVEIFHEYVGPLNLALARIFGETSEHVIQLINFDDPEPQKAPQLWFNKGASRITYDVLSHGEKQVVIALLNFLVRKEHLQGSIVFVDEMDAHMNTALQFRLIKEITENWIPDDSQFWTATHSIGFIDYARRSQHAAILDFSGRDFDIPQNIAPTKNNDFGLYDIAVDASLLADLAGNRELVFVENTDIKYYTSVLGTPSRLLLPARDKRTAFYTSQALDTRCLIDRDFLTDDERVEIQDHYPTCLILNYYSVENYLYHPENVKEALGNGFDLDTYIKTWCAARDSNLSGLVVNLKDARRSYPFYLDPGQEKDAKRFQQGAAKVAETLTSSDFEVFYRVFPAKDHGGSARAAVHLGKEDLARTAWFRDQVRALLP